MNFGKRFIFATIAVIAVSVTTCLLQYRGEIYIKLVGAIATLFVAGQTITDYKKGE